MMKKKMMASLLVGSAVVGASLAPLSAQATTTGNTPVQVEFGGGVLPDGNGDPNTVDPDPTQPNSNFDLLFVPREYDFGKLTISDDLTKVIPNKADTGTNGHIESVGVGDLRGTKEGWHLTVQSDGLKLGNEELEGYIVSGLIEEYDVVYKEEVGSYGILKPAVSVPETRPEIPVANNWKFNLGGDAVLLANATIGRGQGTWGFMMYSTSLKITTPANDIKAGAYTGNVTWNLVAGPSI